MRPSDDDKCCHEYVVTCHVHQCSDDDEQANSRQFDTLRKELGWCGAVEPIVIVVMPTISHLCLFKVCSVLSTSMDVYQVLTYLLLYCLYLYSLKMYLKNQNERIFRYKIYTHDGYCLLFCEGGCQCSLSVFSEL